MFLLPMEEFGFHFYTYDIINISVYRAVAIAVMIILAGCGGGATSTDTAAPTQTQTSTPTATPTATPAPPPDNPYESDPVIVGIENPTNRSYAPLVREAIEYWQTDASEYREYSANYSIQPDAPAPDLTIRFVDEIYSCGQELGNNILGCAPYPDGISQYGGNEVLIERGDNGGNYTDASLLSTIKHEFGHLYGVEHGEQPMPLMDEASVANLTAQPNATERAIPWQYDTLQIYVDEESFASSTQDELDRQVNNTLAWFNEGKGTTPEGLTIEQTQDRTEADIIVTSGSVSEGYLSRVEGIYGRDTDNDGALEYYSNATFIIDPQVDAHDFGWHIGFLMEYVVNPDKRSEPFTDPEGGERRDWWES